MNLLQRMQQGAEAQAAACGAAVLQQPCSLAVPAAVVGATQVADLTIALLTAFLDAAQGISYGAALATRRFLGTNLGREEWVNPVLAGRVEVRKQPGAAEFKEEARMGAWQCASGGRRPARCAYPV